MKLIKLTEKGNPHSLFINPNHVLTLEGDLSGELTLLCFSTGSKLTVDINVEKVAHILNSGLINNNRISLKK